MSRTPTLIYLLDWYCYWSNSGGSILKLHEDVQTCGYKDVQVMFEILKSELEESRTPKQRKPPAAWRPPPALWIQGRTGDVRDSEI
uniref:Uncharacterized protein n=1 Tax=Oryza brachyantha TaxID=4533 RepID=J3M145_ORYBR